VEELCTEGKVVAVGEIGLDFHYDFAPAMSRNGCSELSSDRRPEESPCCDPHADATEQTVRIVREALESFPDCALRPPRRSAGSLHQGDLPLLPRRPALAWDLIKLGFAVSLPES